MVYAPRVTNRENIKLRVEETHKEISKDTAHCVLF